MLAGKRAVRVGDQLLREIADLVVKKVNDPRVKGATITGIHLSNDLKNARVYYSLIGDNNDVLRTQAGFDRAKGFIKREIGNRMELKYIPDIIFKHDPSMEKGSYMDRLFEKLKSDKPIDSNE
ncbi:MAG: 30S ribosome-binding factor RbfA [Deltaproteobacteria bacterium]|nr:30S ribosome-binding factor RbfA [Deltaproteobacteria bacterium]